MRETPIGNLIRAVRVIAPDDTIGKAAELLRMSGLPELPVVSAWHVLGKVTEDSVLRALNTTDPTAVAEKPVEEIISRQVVCVNPYMTLAQVAGVMSDHGLAVTPVIDENGRYIGVAARSDVTSALSLMIRPPMVAGIATPIGVYLTTGNLRAGAGDLGLFLSGVALMLMYFAAVGAIYGAALLLDKTGAFAPWSLWAILHSTPIPIPNWMDGVKMVMLGATVPIFLALLRILPISGYHAAEHQVVHAIENGEPLTAANVSAMPRVHPRCGTNIVAGVALFFLVRQVLSDEVALLVFVFVLVLAWRSVGAYFQQYITTKPPSAKQLESGIRAGESLIEKYREHPGYRVTGWRRIWNTGMPQVMLGAAATLGVGEIIQAAVEKLI